VKIIYQGDMHLRDSTPVNRIDNYYERQLEKLEQLVGFAVDNEALLLIGGDLFDTYRVSCALLNRTIEILSHSYDNQIVAVCGQHDEPYHNGDLMKSPVGILHQAEILTCLSEEGANIGASIGKDKANEAEVTIYGASWEKTPAKPIPGTFNILLGHISVFKEIPFYWKGEGYTPKTLKEKYPGYDLYLCGDIHEPLVDDNVVVSGSMMRMSINQVDERPRAYLIDTDTGKIEPLYYTIEKDVFTVPSAEVKEDLHLDSLVLALKESSGLKRCYEQDCLDLSKGDKFVNNIIKETFDGLS
jgi:DNA repair exonuclease SbcCD nuclease subunit